MSNKIIRWGILGAARINQQLMPAIIEAEQSELIAIASRRAGAAEQTLASYGTAAQTEVKVMQDMDELINMPGIDAVYIPLSNHEHAEWALKAIESGKHVLCEKPMALKVSDIDTIEQAAKARGVVVMEGFMYRFHPQHIRTREIMASGIIGEVRSVRSCFSYMMQDARLYRIADPIAEGGGAMWDIGCYAIHAARFAFDDALPTAVTAMAKHAENGADISCNGILDFSDGRYAHFDFGFEHARCAEYEIIGTKGGLKCHNVWAKQAETPVISWWTEAGEKQEETLPLANHFKLEIEHFVQCVLNRQSPDLSLENARSNCLIINSVLESIQTGRHIALPGIP